MSECMLQSMFECDRHFAAAIDMPSGFTSTYVTYNVRIWKMSNRIEAVLSGAANQIEVTGKWQESFDGQQDVKESLGHFRHGLDTLMQNEQTRRAALAIVAATLNKEFDKTGWLWHCREDGQLTKQFFSSDSDRKLIGSMLDC